GAHRLRRDDVRHGLGPVRRDAARVGRPRRAREAHRCGGCELARLVRGVHGGGAVREGTAEVSIWNVTFPSLLGVQGFSLFIVRLVVALVFGASGYYHLRDPAGRAKGLGIPTAAAVGLGVAEILGSLGLVTGILIQPAALGLILLGLGAIQKKVFTW